MQVTLPRQAVVRQVSPHQVTIQRTRTGVVDTGTTANIIIKQIHPQFLIVSLLCCVVAGIVQEVKRDMQKKEHQKTRLQQRLLENKVELENCQRESRDQEEVTGRLTAALSRNTSKLAALKLEIQAYGTRADEFEVEPYNFYCSLVTESKDTRVRVRAPHPPQHYLTVPVPAL
jgi:septal ring factor EnvC (AmiA/AmiB activator)